METDIRDELKEDFELLAEWRLALGYGAPLFWGQEWDQLKGGPQELRGWLEKQHGAEVLVSDILRSGPAPLRKRAVLNEALAVLIDYGFVEEV